MLGNTHKLRFRFSLLSFSISHIFFIPLWNPLAFHPLQPRRPGMRRVHGPRVFFYSTKISRGPLNGAPSSASAHSSGSGRAPFSRHGASLHSAGGGGTGKRKSAPTARFFILSLDKKKKILPFDGKGFCVVTMDLLH